MNLFANFTREYRNYLVAGLSIFSSIVLFSSCNRSEIDYLITGAIVFDGSAGEPKMLDVGVKDDRIVLVERAGKTRKKAIRIIDGTGLYLSPGFIDPHTHALPDLNNETDRSMQTFLWQGVTTVLEGNDGSGPYPIGFQLNTWAEKGLGINAGLFVGHGTVRGKVMGKKDTIASPDGIKAMQELVREAMKEGAFGLSTGLFYSPGSFASTDEVISLAKVAAEYGGIYDTHLRDESSYGIGLIGSVNETIEIGEKAEIPVHISHIKALGRDVWGQSEEVIKMINEARERSVNITANQYPYLASQTGLKAAVVPRWAEDGGNDLMIARFDDPALSDKLNREMAENIHRRGGANTLIFIGMGKDSLKGLSLEDAAAKMMLDEVSAAKEILRNSPGIGIVSFNMLESDVLNFMKQPWVMTGSDGSSGHPRKYGTFPRKIKVYCIEKGVISMSDAIFRSTGLTAETFRIKERGRILKGYYADIILFNIDEISDEATFDEPFRYARGMKYIFVNGQLVVDNGEYTGKLPGRSLRLTD